MWPAVILVDNSSGIVFQQSMNPTSKLKGVFNLRWNWVTELQDKQRIKAVKVETKYNVADILTKPLSKFCDFESQICQLVGSLRVGRGVVSTGGFSLVLAGGEFDQAAKKRGGGAVAKF